MMALTDGSEKCRMCGMKRGSYIDKLESWARSSRRKPLILEGARQVGKTWLMQEFAKTHFENVIYARQLLWV